MDATNARGIHRIAAWFVCLWTAFVTFRFATVVDRSIREPLNRGLDARWAIAAVAVSLLLLVAFSLSRRSLAGALGIAVAAAIAFIIAWQSASIVALAVALWIVVVCAALGMALLRSCVHERLSWSCQIACGLPLGFGALASVLFVLGVLHLWSRPVFLGLLLLVSGLCWWKFKDVRVLDLLDGIVFRYPFKDLSLEAHLLLGLMAYSALLNFTWAVAPEIQFDALNYHLAIPRIDLAHSGLVNVEFFHAYLVHLVELVFALALAIAGPGAVKILVFSLGIGTAWAAYELGICFSGARAGLWTAALFYTTPVVGWLSGTTYIDNIIALMVTASLIAVARWYRSRSGGWLLAASILAGIAVGSKINAAFVFVVIGPALLWELVRAKRFRELLRAAAVSLALASPMYIWVYVQTHNPVFPLLNGIFKSSKLDPVNSVMNAEQFGYPHTLGWLLRFPFRLTLETGRFGEAMPRGNIGAALMLVLPFLLLWVFRRRKPAMIFLLAAAAHLTFLFFLMQYARYVVPILPLLTALGLAAALDLVRERWALRTFLGLLFVLCVAQLCLGSVQYWNLAERFPLKLALGQETRESFLSRTLEGYDSAVYLNRVVQPGQKILGLDVEDKRFYLDAPLETAPLSLKDNPLHDTIGMPPSAELMHKLQDLGFVWFFTEKADIKNPDTAPFPYLDPAFLASYGQLEYQDQKTVVYRIGVPAGPFGVLK